jgi:hypothetical protein
MSAAAFLGARRTFGQESLDRACLAGEKFLVALADVLPNLRIADFLFVLQLIGRELRNMLITRPDTLNSTRSPGLIPALRRMLFGTVISAFGLRVTVIVMVPRAHL